MEARQPQTEAPIRGSVSTYRCLLNIYPQAFRREYAELMAQVFRDQCRDAYSRSGNAGLIESWVEVIPDLVGTALAEQVRDRSVWNMLSSKFLSASEVWALFGGIAWMIFSIYPWSFWTFVGAPILVIVMLVSLKQQLGKNSLAQVGLVLATLGAIVFGPFMTQMIGSQSDWAMPYVTVGWGFFCLGIALIGVAFLRTRPLPVWNGLPLISAALMAAQWAVVAYPAFFNPRALYENFWFWPFMGFGVLGGLGWAALSVASIINAQPERGAVAPQ